MLDTHHSNAPGRSPREDRARTLSLWLANQRAISTSMVETTAWLIIDSARREPLEVSGPRAPVVVQPRFSLWLVGQLGGRPDIHIFADETTAAARARELGVELRVPVLLIDRGGAITERIDPIESVDPMIQSTPKTTVTRSAPVTPAAGAGPLLVRSMAGIPMTTAPAVQTAMPAPEVHAAIPAPEVCGMPAPIPAPVESPSAQSLRLNVARHEQRWGVFLTGRLMATAPTREQARLRARALKDDPTFTADPQPLADE